MIRLILLFFSFTIINASAQNMLSKQLSSIDYKSISKKRMMEILKNEKDVKRNPICTPGNYYYELSDGRVIFDVIDVKFYLFKDYGDLIKFIDILSNPRNLSDSVNSITYPINNPEFLSEKDDKIRIFLTEKNLKLDFADLADTEKLDVFINSIPFDRLLEFRELMIALVGEFIIQNVKEARWTMFNVPKDTNNPLIFVGDTDMISPMSIFDEEYNKKAKTQKYKFRMGKQVIDIVQSFR